MLARFNEVHRMNRRRLEALRNLAERPGTEAEGVLAKEILARVEARQTAPDDFERIDTFLRTGNLSDLGDLLKYTRCDCGNKYRRYDSCPMTSEHERIAKLIRERFTRGQRVYYNMWAYRMNESGSITGYSKTWNWLRIKFDSLKNSRAVPVYRNGLWHLSADPVDAETLRATGMRGGMEKIEEVVP